MAAPIIFDVDAPEADAPKPKREPWELQREARARILGPLKLRMQADVCLAAADASPDSLPVTMREHYTLATIAATRVVAMYIDAAMRRSESEPDLDDRYALYVIPGELFSAAFTAAFSAIESAAK